VRPTAVIIGAVRTILVTLIGPERTSDLAIDADTAVAELMPNLLAASGVAGSPSPDQWTLAVMGRDPLSPLITLEQAEVLDGSILVLRPETSPRTVRPRGGLAAPGAGGSPLRRARERLRADGRSAVEVITAAKLTRCPTIAVASPKGGAGKTTLSILLGEAFAQYRSEPILVLDADSDYGSLTRIGPPSSVAVLRDLSEGTVTFADLDRTLWMLPGGLRPVPAPTDPREMAAVDRPMYTRALGTLQRLAGILLVDCGSGLGQPGVQASIVACDQIVLVTDATRPTTRLVAEATALLARSGRPITVICNRLPRGRAGDEALAQIDALFPEATGLIGIPEDDAAILALQGELDFGRASRTLHDAVLEAAALLTLGWPSLGLTSD
jgi:MinD-like ATPase involved in chromosome partitioning or flagellar assembly